eukprot:1154236-Pelagomonas_calceolata.AAC.15
MPHSPARSTIIWAPFLGVNKKSSPHSLLHAAWLPAMPHLGDQRRAHHSGTGSGPLVAAAAAAACVAAPPAGVLRLH